MIDVFSSKEETFFYYTLGRKFGRESDPRDSFLRKPHRLQTITSNEIHSKLRFVGQLVRRSRSPRPYVLLPDCASRINFILFPDSNLFQAISLMCVNRTFENTICSLSVSINCRVLFFFFPVTKKKKVTWMTQWNVCWFLEEARKKKFGKKHKKHLAKLLALAMLIKSKISLLLQLISTHFQLKFFVIAIISLILNAIRFWIEVKKSHPSKVIYYEHAQHQHHYDHDDHDHYWGRSSNETPHELAYRAYVPAEWHRRRTHVWPKRQWFCSRIIEEISSTKWRNSHSKIIIVIVLYLF